MHAFKSYVALPKLGLEEDSQQILTDSIDPIASSHAQGLPTASPEVIARNSQGSLLGFQ